MGRADGDHDSGVLRVSMKSRPQGRTVDQLKYAALRVPGLVEPPPAARPGRGWSPVEYETTYYPSRTGTRRGRFAMSRVPTDPRHFTANPWLGQAGMQGVLERPLGADQATRSYNLARPGNFLRSYERTYS